MSNLKASSQNKTQRNSSGFITIDPSGLAALSKKGKADPSAVRTVKCRTVAQGNKFRHLNYVRNLAPHIVDEPAPLLGDDTAPNPTEALLAALGTCVAVGLQANAVAKGWAINAISVEVEGDINITSVWGTGDLSPKTVGLSDVRIRVDLDIDDVSEEEIDQLIAHATKWSPVLNTIKNTVNISAQRA